jgi:hypothetical protein
MLHEILLALLGTTGGIIIEADGKFIVNPKLTFITPAEAEMLNRIANIGALFKKIS